MSGMGAVLVIMMLAFFGLLIGLVLFIVSIYNRLVAGKNRYVNAFSQIDVQLKRRYDLIPNLVETARAYLQHERETLEAVITARNKAVAGLENASQDPTNAVKLRQLGAADSALTGALGRLSVVMEAYPDLKASENMKQVSEELTSTENRVAFARQAYNDQVMAYNTLRQSFPTVLFAPFFGHTRDATQLQFKDREAIQQAPKVAF
jgi:LemA protein